MDNTMKHRRVLVPALLLCLVVSVAAAPDTSERLSEQIEAVLQKHQLGRAFFGAKVVWLQNGQVLYARNSSSYFMPASNMKLLTAVAAAEILGLDYRFETILGTNGTIVDGALEGDLIVVGSGDPTIGARLNSPDWEKVEEGDPFAIFRQWSEQLKSRGIKRVTGDLVADATVFAGPERGAGWAWDDVAWGYCAPVSGLQFNENTALLRIPPPTAPVFAPAVELIPSGALRLVNLLSYAGKEDQPEVDATVLAPGVIELKGKVRTDRTSLYSLAVSAPPEYFLVMLKQTLTQSGIQVDGGTRVIPESTAVPQSLQSLLTFDSPDLRTVLKIMLKVSQNLYAETLLKVLSPARKGKTFEDGSDQVRQFLCGIGVPEDGFVVADGSGLSRYNLLTPDTLVTLLGHAYRSSYGPDLMEFLPIGGVDGTLRQRMQASAATANARAKTGTLMYVRCLSGYIDTRDGERLAFSLMLNHAPRQLMEKPESVLDEIAALLAEYRRE
ncbi:MAG: D-alanyl-D-alanine carboxypeptidase/D-alanyl-D-alanine-endopeptidase [Acidobacteria bacterium]|nr:MAG: D-alanyl-D-alanine carboxypeptidase/D-alanyl-D-alanine-endopeptidase [Acidobacteriota bacterium]